MTCKRSLVQVQYRPSCSLRKGQLPDLKELLKELQATDKELERLTTESEAIPEKISALKDEIQGFRDGFENLKNTLTNSRKDLKLAELNLATQEEALAKYNAQLFSAKTNEEYKAFLKEIETAEKKKAEIEDQIISLMEEIEGEEAEVAKQETEHKQEIAKREAEIKEIEGGKVGLDKQINVLTDKRDRLRGEIPDDTLGIYDRIRESKGTLAVAQILEDERCSACLNPVPTQKVIEASQSENLTFCEYCGRILLV